MTIPIQSVAATVTDWSAAVRELKALGEAEARQRPALEEYSDRTPLRAIPLLALDCAEHEHHPGRPWGIWSLNHGPLDEFSGEYLEIADRLGRGLPDRPTSVSPAAFLFHCLSVWLFSQGTQHPRAFLRLLEKPLPEGRWIPVRQIVHLIKATERFARHLAINPSGLPLAAEASWLLVQSAKLDPYPGFQAYPRWIDRPDGRMGMVQNRDEHAQLFTAEWITRGIGQTGAEPTAIFEASEDDPPSAPVITEGTRTGAGDPINREALYGAAKMKHPEWASRGFANWCRQHGFDSKAFSRWLKRKERPNKPGTLIYPDSSPTADKIVAALKM